MISIDAGRSAVKVFDGEKKFIFRSVLGFLSAKDIEGLVFKSSKSMFYDKKNDQFFIVGQDADKFVKDPIRITNDTLFLSNYYYFLCEALNNLDADNEISIITDLTYNNFYLRNFLKESLKKIEVVPVVNGVIAESKIFNIKSFYTVYQGWAGIMDVLIDDKFNYVNEYVEKIGRGRGVVIDIGDKTTDITIISKLNPIEGRSENFGVSNIYLEIQKELVRDKGVKLSVFDIENFVKKDEVIRALDGGVVDLSFYSERAIKRSSIILRDFIIEILGDNIFDYVYLIGGGAIVFKDYLHEIAPVAEIVNDPIFANAIGAFKFACKSGLK